MRASRVALATLLSASLATGVAAGSAPALRAPKVTLSTALPGLVRIGQIVSVAGHVTAARAGTEAVLERKGPSSQWRSVARARLRTRASFTIRWRVGARDAVGPALLRVAAVRRGRVLAATRPAQSVVGPAPDYCTAPVPPAVDIPVGDGWIVGGQYIEGGPYPGVYACDGQPYTVTARDVNGAVVATQNVAGGHSYTLVVPAGSYQLSSGSCFGSATVAAGRQTKADTVCPVP